MGETFCCINCRLMQERAPTCAECGASTMISLERGAEALAYGGTSIAVSPQTRREKVANIAGGIGIVGGYAGLIAGAALWWPAVPLILGVGVGGIGVAAWRSREVPIAAIDPLAVASAAGAVEKRGVARKLSETVKSVVDGAPVLVEEVLIRPPRGKGVLLRRTNAVPFVVDVDGERVVVAGAVRVTSATTRRKLKKSDPIAAALGIPPTVPVAGALDTVRVRDGDRVRVTGALTVEMVPELAFHRDAGEATVMRGVANAVVAIACEEGST